MTMRKWLIFVLVLMVSVGAVQAQDKPTQAPIIALAENKLYTVSPVDGSAKVSVEPPAEQTFLMSGFASMSPDGTHMVYATQTDPESLTGYVVTVFVLDVTAGKTEVLQPSGGVFDRPARKNYHFRLDYPTWSVDGARLYYVRSEVDDVGHGKKESVQLAYYDMATKTHKLAARLDPKLYVQNLMVVEKGIVVHFSGGLGADQPVTLYALDNRVLSENTIVNLYPYSVRYENQDYYATGEQYGGISTLIHIESGENQPIEGGYYPAARSRADGDKSLHIYRFIGTTGTWYSVYGADYQHYLGEIAEMGGVHFAFAPDGQSVAYLQFDGSLKRSAPIRIMEASGTVRDLPFKAEEILWSASEWVAFYAPG